MEIVTSFYIQGEKPRRDVVKVYCSPVDLGKCLQYDPQSTTVELIGDTVFITEAVDYAGVKRVHTITRREL